MDLQRINQHKKAFDEIMHIIKSDDEKKEVEVWFAREQQAVLCYAPMRKFHSDDQQSC